MNTISLIGAFIITLSLLSYGIGTITLQRFKLVVPGVLVFLSAGILLDIIAVVFMIYGARTSPFSWHGMVGYIAFLTMVIDVISVWRYYLKHGNEVKVERKVLLISRISYSIWVIAYIAGSIMIIWK